MKSVIVISSGSLDLGRMCEAYSEVGSASLQSSDRLVVEGSWGWFAIGIDGGLQGEFADTEQARIAELVADPIYAQLEYSSSSAADMAIRLMPVTTETLIDNDHGMLLPIGEVRDLIRAGMEWKTSSL